MNRRITPIILIVLSVITLLPLAADGNPTFPLDPGTVNAFDRATMCSYNKTLDNISKGLNIAALLTPAILIAEPSDQYITIGVMYAETLAVAFGTKELLKYLVEKPRPYMYYDDYPQDKVDSGDWKKAFPSGHTISAFAGASFASYVFSKYNPDSKWKIPVIAASYTLATATAALRIGCGKHFMTDVLAGALIGTAIGIGVPALHTLLADKDASVSASPFGLVFSLRFK